MAKRMAKPKGKGASRASKPLKAGAKAKTASASAGGRIDAQSRSKGDWRAEALAAVRRMIREADPEITEEVKWVKPSNPMGVPTWSHAGIVCTGETYKDKIKLTFAKGASLDDPTGLFNAGLDGGTRRAIDIREGEALDGKAFKALVKAAAAENVRASASKAKASSKPAATTKPGTKGAKGVKLLSGGNPQIEMGYGDGPVQEYIDAMPGWKGELGKRLDTLIVLNVPEVQKAVKWNSPFYGIEGQGWFLSFHCFDKYVKVGFFRGSSLRPLPPGESKQDEVRYLDIRENDALDDAQFADWVKQASRLPGQRM